LHDLAWCSFFVSALLLSIHQNIILPANVPCL